MSQEGVAENIMALMRAGWSIGDAAFVCVAGERVWVVSGHNGENLIRAEGATQDEAWRRGVEQVREMGDAEAGLKPFLATSEAIPQSEKPRRPASTGRRGFVLSGGGAGSLVWSR